MMTRNDFEILARHLKAMYPSDPVEPDILKRQEQLAYRDGYNAAINQVMGACSAVNARFNAVTFRLACGLPAKIVHRALPDHAQFAPGARNG